MEAFRLRQEIKSCLNKHPILVVDDNEIFIENFKEFMGSRGLNPIHHAINGQEALEKLSEISPSLILLDLKMPVMTGEEVLPLLRGKRGTEKVAVGMPVTRHPPHRSQRAELPHWAPTSDVNLNSLLWIRM